MADRPGKGQVWSLDFVISVSVFIILVATLIFVWNYSSQQNWEQLELNRIEEKTLSVSDALVRSPGLPEEWNSSTVDVVGLAITGRENVLDPGKVREFLALSYSDSRSILGLGGYQYYFRLKTAENRTIEVEGEEAVKGSYPSEAELSVPVRRLVLVNGTVGTMEFILWR